MQSKCAALTACYTLFLFYYTSQITNSQTEIQPASANRNTAGAAHDEPATDANTVSSFAAARYVCHTHLQIETND